MRRRPVVVRRGPGLLRVAATTAVVAGTATAVSGAVGKKGQGQAAQPAAGAAPQAAPPASSQEPRAAPAGPASDRVSQLERLAELQKQGVLTPEEFAAEKARILQS